MKKCAAGLLALLVAGASAGGSSAKADERLPYDTNKTFDELTHAEKTAAKRAARTRKLPSLRVCADPGNMPMSNNKGEGYQNKIIEALGRAMDTKIEYFWRPYFEQGLAREAFVKNQCDVLLDFPPDYQGLLTTEPVYRTTYVFATREDSGIDIKNFEDPALAELKIGAYQHSGMRLVLAKHGITDLSVHVISHRADLVPEEQPWRQVQEVLDGKLDVAAVWGPFAGWLKTMKGEPLNIQPVNRMDDEVQLEFDLAFGVPKTGAILKFMLEDALDEKKDEIERILKDYGVPLVKCSKCVVAGDIPSHGTFFTAKQEKVRRLYLETLPAEQTQLNKDVASKDQVVTNERLERWLKKGADLNEELSNAIVASDPERVVFLLGKGADVNERNKQGFPPALMAARQRDTDMLALLIENGAELGGTDPDGWNTLTHAVYRNHVPTIEVLVAAGTDIETGPPGFTPLAVALSENKSYAAKALIDGGADVNSVSGDDRLTPLMQVAAQKQFDQRAQSVSQGMSAVDLARLLIEEGADVNATSAKGVTPLMVAAAHDNPPLIGLLIQSGADPAIKSSNGKTALEIAKFNKNAAAVQQLELLGTSRKRGTAQRKPDAPGGSVTQ